jgi:sialate O-acetylesterase
MMRRILVGSLCLLPATILSAEIRLSVLFSDHMVVQRNGPIPVWGTADPGEEVAIALGSRKAATRTDSNGRWRLVLEPMTAGGPYVLIAVGANRVNVQDVMVGEVWLASGQSNMELPVSRVTNARQAVDQSAESLLRMFTVQQHATREPVEEVSGRWEVASPETTAQFSATAYFFARQLVADLRIPVGIIHASWGATAAEPWINDTDLRADPLLAALLDKSITALDRLPAEEQRYLVEIAAWEEKYSAKDSGNKGLSRGWAAPDVDLSAWKPVLLPSTGARLGLSRGGAIWLRKDIETADPAAAAAWTFDLGPMGEQDTAYFNGVEFATSGPDPLHSALPWRVYNLPSKLVRKGRNTLAIRVFFHHPSRAILSRGHELDLFGDGGRQLSGEWLMRVESELPEVDAAAVASLPHVPRTPAEYQPSVLFHSMIAPLRPFAIRGAIWYQGESNASRAREYRIVFPMLIESWRKYWGRDEFPFYFVQLPNYGEPIAVPGDSSWAELREAQMITAKSVPNTGMAITIDIGEALSVHPQNKPEAGRRLALVALAQTYGRPGEWSGPLYDSMAIEQGAARIKFSHIGSGLLARGGPLAQFSIAGKDRKFVLADAEIDGDSVWVSSPRVPDPVAVRYAWSDNPIGCNLYNVEGLPAAPFRTDTWPRQ